MKNFFQLEKEYLLDLAEKQLTQLKAINGICLIYAIIGYFTIAKIMCDTVAHGKLEYAILTSIAAFLFISSLIAGKLIKPQDKEGRLKAVHALITITEQAYLLWGLFDMYISMIEHRTTNVWPWLMAFAIIITAFNSPIAEFLAFYTLNIVYLRILFRLCPHETLTLGTVLDMVNFAILMAVMYILKHVIKVRAFRDRKLAEQAQNTRNLFAASMNHELRAPLNSIIGNSQIMLMNENMSSDNREIAENILASSKTMVQLVNDMLDLSRLEAGEFDIIPAEFSLKDLRDNVYSMMMPLAKEKGLKFTIEIEDGTPLQVVADSRRIQQVIVNIASNSIKYTSEGSVKVDMWMIKNNLHVKVADTGMGMAQDTIDDLFAPFKRINEGKTKNIQGTGLGMFIVKNLLNQMDGTIDVKSTLGAGTSMEVVFPVEIVQQSEVSVELAGESSDIQGATTAEKKYDFSDKTILCVDDTVMNNRVMQSLLATTGATVFAVLDAKSCLEFIDKKSCDLVLLDHLMPHVSGLECLEQIRNGKEKTKDIPVIMLTGNAGEEYKALYEKSGANGYVMKPVMKENLFETIASVI